MEHILSLSYGKDSLACLGAIEELGWTLDRIVHAEVWATDTVPADLPPMVEFKKKADRIIKDRWGIEVEHVCAMRDGKRLTYENVFYRKRESSRNGNTVHKMYGWPFQKGSWCKDRLKTGILDRSAQDCVQYLGIALDEPNRFHVLSDGQKSPLVEAGWDEAFCRHWCEENDLLSPIYTSATRGGCWFCHNQGVEQLRLLRKNYPDYWAMMLKWDSDSPVSFKPDGHTVHDYDRRFALEDMGLVPMAGTFRWSIVSDYDQWPIMPEVLRLRTSGDDFCSRGEARRDTEVKAMDKQIDICSTCVFGVQNYTSIIGNIPWCCEKHWHCKPGTLKSDYVPKKKKEGIKSEKT